jgi:hypothetical protein
VAKVILDVEVRVVHPHRALDAPRYESELLTEAWDEMQAAPDLLDRFLVVDDASFEDRDGRHVHVRLGVFQMQEHRVRRCEALSAHRPPKFCEVTSLTPGHEACKRYPRCR